MSHVARAASRSAPSAPNQTHSESSTGPVRLHYVEAGQGEPAVLLHGFPEFWYSWRHQLPALADAGFRAVAPDLRGYNESDHPPGVESYRTAELVEDVAGLIRERAGGTAFLVGHDWGGVVAWRLAALYPDLVRKLAVLNAPHPAAFREELWRNPGQWVRSSYTLFFQLPWLPEKVLGARDFAFLGRALRGQPAHPEAFSERDVVEYKRAFGRPGGLTGPLNYYRAAARFPNDLFGPPQTVRVPTLVVWGTRDRFLSTTLAQRLGPWVPDLRVEWIPDAGHWVQNEAPERVNRLLVDFFTEEPPAAGGT